MGKTKTKSVSEEPKKKAVSGVGLKGGERIKIIEAGPIIKAPSTKSEIQEEKEVKKQEKPKVRSKKYVSSLKAFDKSKAHPLLEAIALAKKVSYSSFDGTIEMHINVKRTVSTKIEPPYPTGKQKKIEFTSEETIEKLKLGKLDFAVLLATAEMMPKLVPFAKLLGPKGLMPNPKNGTLVKSADAAKKFSGSALEIKTQKGANVIHTYIGKVSQKEKELEGNALAVLAAAGAKNIVSAYIKPTMGPAIKLQIE